MEEKKEEQQQEAEKLFYKALEFQLGKDYEKAEYYYLKAAELNYPLAQNNLGSMYYNGLLGEPDYKKAVFYFKKAADKGHVIAIKNLGQCYSNGYGVSLDLEKAAGYYLKAAEKGYILAMNHIGYMYENGLGVTKDYVRSFYWYNKAAELGNISSKVSLGKQYLFGLGVERDSAKALSLFEEAANAGDNWAMDNIANIFQRGDLVKQDLDKSRLYYQKAFDGFKSAALLDDINAFGKLGDYYFHGVSLIGLKQDFGQAVRWYKKAADGGLSSAQNILGICYDKGLGVGQNYKTSFYWYKQAAMQDDVSALFNLGNCYFSGKGVERDAEKGAEFIARAAEKGDIEAYSYLGNMYRLGKGVEKNYQLAVKWLKKACDANNPSAFADLGLLYYFGNYVEQDYCYALELFKIGATMGDLPAKVMEAYCYMMGVGTLDNKTDIKQAAEILEPICGEQEKYRNNNISFIKIERELSYQIYNPLDVIALPYYAKAYYLLAIIYASGADGVKKDTAKANRLLNIAENLGYKDTENSKYTISDLRKAIATNPESESVPSQGQLIVTKHSCHNKQFGLYNFIYKRADDTELTLKFSTKRAKFIYLMTVLSAKVGLPLRSTMFEELKDEMIQLTLDLGIQGPNESKTWVSKFYSDVDYKAGAYSTAGSNVNTCFKKNMTLQDYEICKLEQPGRGRNSVKTLGLSPDNIDVDPFFNDFMDAIQRVKKANATE